MTRGKEKGIRNEREDVTVKRSKGERENKVVGGQRKLKTKTKK